LRNQYIVNQLNHMLSTTKIFQQACSMAAIQDDGVVDKKEEKALKAISAATEKYVKELTKVLEKY